MILKIADQSFILIWVTLKHGVPLMGYPIGVPIGVPLYCNIWKSFWNILNFNIIFHLLCCEGHRARMKFRQETGEASFSCYWHLKFTPEKPNSYITTSVSKLQVPCCSPYRGRMFPHSYALSHRLIFAKTHFMWN